MFKKVLHTFFTSLLIAGGTFLTTSLLSKYFGAGGLGEIGVFLFVCAIIAVLSAVIGSSTIVYVLPKYTFGPVFIAASIWAIISSGIGVLVVDLFGYYQQNLIWLFVVSLAQSFYVNHLSFLLALNQIKRYNLIRLLQPLLLVLVLLSCWLIGFNADINFYFPLLLCTYLLPMILIFAYLSPNFRQSVSNLETFKKVIFTFFSFGGIGQITNLFQLLNYRISYFLLVFYCSKAEVGLMVLALTFVEGIWLFKNSMSMLKYVQTAINEKVDYTNDRLTKISLLVTFLMLVMALLVPNEMYSFFFGKDFSALKKLLIYMSPGILAMALSSVYANFFAGLGKVKFNLLAAVVGFIFFLPSVYFLTKFYGVVGAALANNVPLVLGTLVTLYFNRELSNKEI